MSTIIDQLKSIIRHPEYGDWDKAVAIAPILKEVATADDNSDLLTVALACIIKIVRLKSLHDTATVYRNLADQHIQNSNHLGLVEEQEGGFLIKSETLKKLLGQAMRETPIANHPKEDTPNG